MLLRINVDFKHTDNNSQLQLGGVSLSESINVSDYSQAFQEFYNVYRVSGFQLSPSSSHIVSRLTGKRTFFDIDGYKGYISKEISPVQNYIQLQFNIVNNIPDYLYITFDTATNEYAKSIKVLNSINNQVLNITNDSVYCIIPLQSLNLTAPVKITLELRYWSNPNNQSFKVTNISNNFNLVIGSNDIISSVNSENMMDTELNIQPGICEQYADIQIYDRTGIFHELALRELLSQDERISIYTDNDILIGVYYVKEWSIENDNDIINITCRDNSYLFQKIDIKRSLIATRTLHDLLNILFSQATEVSWEYMDIETELRCKNITIPNSWYLSSNLYDMLSKICEVGMLRMYFYTDTFRVGRCV